MWQTWPIGKKDSRLNEKNSYLPTVMDFPLAFILNEYKGAESLNALFRHLSGDRIYANPQNVLTFMDNHDTSRFCHNADEAGNLARYKQALTLLLTLRGIPQLYYGDEIMMYWRQDEGLTVHCAMTSQVAGER
jgi:glycosidase